MECKKDKGRDESWENRAILHGGHGDAGTRVSSISFSPQSGHCLWLGVKVETTLAVKVHVTQDGASATGLYMIDDDDEHTY